MSDRAELKKPTRIWLVAFLAACALLLGVGVAGSFPAACSLCHAVSAHALEESAHASVACYECHLSTGAWSLPRHKAEEFLVMYTRQLSGARGPMLEETSRAACLSCHGAVLEGVTSGRGLRIAHLSCAEGPTCDGCHATVAHAGESGRLSAPSMEECLGCHAAEAVSVECETCHVGDESVTLDSPRPSPWRVTHGDNWRDTHGMGDSSLCDVCHAEDFCAKCHAVTLPHPASFGKTHGRAAISDGSLCRDCHDEAAFCNPCHGMSMPHSTGYIRVHGASAESVDDPRCARCHAMRDCEDCHNNHIHPGGASLPQPPTGSNR
ncbi:MAG: hypothetical protein RQ731_03345 [Anaerosomatales bacterium]|nr:hypothetical protein [Anaerosomatales bacterium]MDT8433777.1 hypothetical protein [Anaerosomatales bacterium]